MKNILKSAINFFVPKNLAQPVVYQSRGKKVIAIIPTYRPTQETYDLIASLMTVSVYDDKKKIRIVVVDDCTPKKGKEVRILEKIAHVAKESRNVYLIRTPRNRAKAGALNYGLNFIKKKKLACDVVLTSDDDIRIETNTISLLVDYLYSNEKFGAVCSMVRTSNKSKNILTRLQGLEYHGFNIAKISDNGFFQGPLVMQGMLTAFRYEAINKVSGYSRKNLIEDYEITAKLKSKDWLVGICQDAYAWTRVPERFPVLWRQRVRWSYWGLFVVKDYLKHIPSIIQDLIGHTIFIVLTGLVLISFLIPSLEAGPIVVKTLIALAISQFLISFSFSIITLRKYKDADLFDYVLRLIVLPELFYATVLSLVVYGSYLFFLYNKLWEKITEKLPRMKIVYVSGLRIFSQVGYSLSWGTR